MLEDGKEDVEKTDSEKFIEECQTFYKLHFIASVIHSLLCILLMFQYQPYERKKKKKFDEDGNVIIEPVDPEEELRLAE